MPHQTNYVIITYLDTVWPILVIFVNFSQRYISDAKILIKILRNFAQKPYFAFLTPALFQLVFRKSESCSESVQKNVT